MGLAMELITGFTTAPGVATFAAVTMASGNSNVIRNAAIGTDIRLLQFWTFKNVAGTIRVRSPKLHDNVQGIRFGDIAAQVDSFLPWGEYQKLVPQDTLTIEMLGSAVGGQIETFSGLIWYADCPGQNARLAMWPDIANRIVNIETIESTITSGAAGGYTGQQAITANFDLTKANTDYALLGYVTNTRCASVRILGADVSNLGVGGPGEPAQRFLTKYWFKMLSEYYQIPTIPIFNSANKGGILIDVATSQSAGTFIINTIWGELSR